MYIPPYRPIRGYGIRSLLANAIAESPHKCCICVRPLRPYIARYVTSELLLLLDWIEMCTQDLIHGEHMHLVFYENRLQLFVTDDHAFVGMVLEVVLFDVVPYSLDGLGA